MIRRLFAFVLLALQRGKNLFSKSGSDESVSLWELYEPSIGLLMVRCLMERQRLLETHGALTEEILYAQAFDYCCNQIGDVVKVPEWVVPGEVYEKWYGMYVRVGAFAGASQSGAADQSLVDVATVFALGVAEKQGNVDMQLMLSEDVKCEVV